jgi:multidrug resistance protein, MATE family
LAIGISTTILVGNRLGAGKWHEAVFSYKVATWITLAVAVACSIVLLALKSVWGYAFTNDEEVVEVISTNLPFLCFFLIGDSLQGSLGGALRGSGRQKWGAAINLGSYYGIGMPIAATLAFAAGWGISGLWTGFSLGSWIVVTCYLLLLSRFSDWPKIAREALESNAQSPSLEDQPTP